MLFLKRGGDDDVVLDSEVSDARGSVFIKDPLLLENRVGVSRIIVYIPYVCVVKNLMLFLYL